MFLDLISGKFKKIYDKEISDENYSVFSDWHSKRVQGICTDNVLQEDTINQYWKAHIIASKSMNFFDPIVWL